MRIYIQWALATPANYVMYDLAVRNQIRNLPSKPEPVAFSFPPLDNQPGWVNAINCQGIIFEGFDHYGLAYEANVRKVTLSGWVDSTSSGFPYATSWELWFPKGDPKFGGAINTDQRGTQYATAGSTQAAIYDDGGVPWLPYSQFAAPAAIATRHGVYMTDAQYAAHSAVRTEPVWRDWVETAAK